MLTKRFFILVAILYIVFIGGTAYTTNNLILRILYHVSTTSFIIIWAVRQRQGWPRTALDWPLMTYVVWLGITTLASQDIRVSLEQIYPFLLHVVWFYILVDVIRNSHQRWLFEALFIAAGVFVAISVLEVASWYFGLGFAGYDIGWFSIHGFDDLIPPEGYKISLALNVSTLVGNWAVVVMIVVLTWMMSVDRRDYQLGLGMLAAGLFLVLMGSGSRGALLALVAAVGMTAAFWMGHRGWLKSRLMLVAMVAGLFAIVLTVMLYTDRSSSTSDRRRVDMWESAISIIGDDPVTGVGVHQFAEEYRERRDKMLIQDKIVSAHNLVLNTGAEIGVPGLLILFWLCGLFLQQWWREWQVAWGPRRVRLEGVLVALSAFGVHSVIDAFTLSSLVFPVLVMAAYVVAGTRSVGLFPLCGVFRFVVVSVFGFYLVWFVRVDVAQVRHLVGLGSLLENDYTQSLRHVESAIDLDPHLELYDLQRAYILGLMAEEDPFTHWSAAIDAHLESLEDNPTFDVGYANLAALYAQAGNYEAAIPHITKAAYIRPDFWEYKVKLAEYLEENSQADAAKATYVRALYQELDIARSDYWQRSDLRQAALEDFYEHASPSTATIVAIYRDWPDRADASVANIDPVESYDYLAMAQYAVYIGDYEGALSHYQRAIETAMSRDNLPGLYAERAEVNLALDNLDDAERDAKTALFLDKVDGARAYYVLAQLRIQDGETDRETIDQYLILAVPPHLIRQEYAVGLFNRPALLDWLPQLALPGQGQIAYEPWCLLQDRYASDNDEDTDPQEVIDAIQESDPYLRNGCP